MDREKWTKSTRCGTSSCVEVTELGGWILVRDSKKPNQAPLSFTREEWSAFRAGILLGEFSF